MFFYQPTLDTLGLKKTLALNELLAGNKRENILLKLGHYILFSCIK